MSGKKSQKPPTLLLNIAFLTGKVALLYNLLLTNGALFKNLPKNFGSFYKLQLMQLCLCDMN